MENAYAHNIKKTFPIYLVAFLFSFHGALSLYINSSFLGKFLPESAIGFIFAAAAVLAIVLLTQLPYTLSRFGNYKTMVGTIILEIIFLILLSLPLAPIFLILAFIFTQVCITLVAFNLDIFLERFSLDTKTGAIRGTFLTVVNFAILFGPLTTGIILTNGDFPKIYLLSILFLIPVVVLSTRFLRTFKDPEYRIVPYMRTVRQILCARHPRDEIWHVVIASFLLRFFFSWMIIYTPLYLFKYVGFNWTEIGIILTIMLLPFILFEIPIGRLADTQIGEKKIMVLGFLIISVSTAALFFVTQASLLLWASLLFVTRIGASFVEITSESYFFKHINSADTEILSVFRNSQLIASIIGPITASLFLVVTNIQYLFLILGLIMLCGIFVAYNMATKSQTKIPA